jgi:UDP-N-acetylenolpyruvoylglucosamine reductase
VQNIGAYGLELKDRFHSLDAVDLVTGRTVTLDARGLRFGYRDSVFKQGGFGGLAGKSLITRVRCACRDPGSRCWATWTWNAAWPRPATPHPDAAHDVRLGVRHPPRQAARPGRHRQCRQLLQEPDRQRRAVPGHHRPRPGDRALPACPTARSSWPPAG